MSYNIYLDGPDPEVRRRADWDPTYNYGDVFERLWPLGIRWLTGKTGAQAAPGLRAAIALLRATPEEVDQALEDRWLDSAAKNYPPGDFGRERNRSWAPSDRNAVKTLERILEGAEAWPHCTFTVR